MFNASRFCLFCGVNHFLASVAPVPMALLAKLAAPLAGRPLK
jgi:hypothetical protein